MKETDLSSDFEKLTDLDEDNTLQSSQQRKTKLPIISDFSGLEKLSCEGSTCETYKWEWSSRVYFVKRLKHEFLGSSQHIHAFEKEFELGSKLSHPSLPCYIDFRHTDRECYIVMEYIDGVTLKDLWHKLITVDRGITYKVMGQLIDVLDYLHRNNIMHYDLIPQNVMLTNGLNNVVLLDLDKAFNSAFAKNAGDPSRFGVDTDGAASSDVDYRGLSIILSKGFWRGMEDGELSHFNDLCNTPGVTSEELKEALMHKYDDLYVSNHKCIDGRTCDGYEGDWQLRPVIIKKLKPDLLNNKYYRDRFVREYEFMNGCEDPTFAYYCLIRNTPEDCFIAIEKPDGITVSAMLSDDNPWIYDTDNIKSLLETLLSSYFYLWSEEGADRMRFDIDDIYVNPVKGYITIANFKEILDATISNTKSRLAMTEVKIVDSASGKVLNTDSILAPDRTCPFELPQLCKIMNQLEEKVDMSWLSDLYKACAYGASYREMSRILKNASPY